VPNPFSIRQEATKPYKDVEEAAAAAKGLHPRILDKGRNFLKAADHLRQTTEAAWKMSEWSGATPVERERALRDYHEAREMFFAAEGQLSAALGGAVHRSELDLAIAEMKPPAASSEGDPAPDAAAG